MRYGIFFILFLSSCLNKNTEKTIIKDEVKFEINQLNLITDTLPWRNKLPAKIIKNEKDTLNLTFRLRGGTSSGFPKHNYLLEFEHKQALGKGIFDDDIILTANYIDKTFLRHVLNYELFNEMDSNNIAPKTNFVWLKQNNKDKGLYVLMEKVNAGMLDLNKKDTSACLFKGPGLFNIKLPTVFQDKDNPNHQKYPSLSKQNKSFEIDNLRSFILESNDSIFKTDFNKHFSLQNIMDWHIILVYSNNHDGIVKNFYLYKKDNLSPFKICIWDCDDGFGRTAGNDLNSHLPEVNLKYSILFKRLIEHPSFNYEEKLNRRYQKHLNKTLKPQRIIKEIDAYYAKLNKVLDDNAKIWPLNNPTYRDSATTKEEFSLIKKYILQRTKEIELRKSIIPND